MKINILSLSIRNFKGIVTLDIEFNGDLTIITGDNGVGKTTISDAYHWLLWGKNSLDEKDFDIKPIDAIHGVVHGVDTQVIGVFQLDGINRTYKRVYSEKWTKRRGSEESELTGHETKFFYNDVPCKQEAYKEKVEGMVKEEVLKLLSNPEYFHALPWSKQREVLVELSGGVSNAEVFEMMEDSPVLKGLKDALNQGKTEAEYKAQLVNQKSKIQSELKTIPTRIDEVDRSRPEPTDYSQLQDAISEKESQLQNVEELLEDASKSYQEQLKGVMEKQRDLSKLKQELDKATIENEKAHRQLMFDIESEISRLKQEWENYKKKQTTLGNDLIYKKEQRTKVSLKRENLLAQWHKINEEPMPEFEVAGNCPTCFQPLPTEDLEKKRGMLQGNWNQDKLRRLNLIERDGIKAKEELANLEAEIAELENLQSPSADYASVIKEKEAELYELHLKQIAPSMEMEDIKWKIENFVVETPPMPDNGPLKDQRKAIMEDINNLKLKKANQKRELQINERIEELKGQERTLSSELVNLEKSEHGLEMFIRAKVDLIDKRVNSKFSLIRFKLFDVQINGALNPTCEATIDGVPYSGLNTAGRINAGLDTLNALMYHYGIQAPVFVDHCESINEMLPVNSQMIKLVVGPKGQELTIM